MYQDERDAMCDSSGRLTGVRYGTFEFDDDPPMLVAVILDFEAGSWVLAVDPDDSTVRITSGEPLPPEDMCIADAPADSPWSAALGAKAQWVWIMVNQRGYEDGIQFCFAVAGRAVCQIQLITMAATWQIGVIHT